MLSQKRTFSSTSSNETANSDETDNSRNVKPKNSEIAILVGITEGINRSSHSKEFKKAFSRHGLPNSSTGEAAKSAWKKTTDLHGPDAYLAQQFFSTLPIKRSKIISLPSPKGTPKRTALFSNFVLGEEEFSGLVSQFPGGRYDDCIGVEEENHLSKILAILEILKLNPDLVLIDGNSVTNVEDGSNMHVYTQSLIKGRYITRQRKYHAEMWMCWNKKDKDSNKSLLDTLKELGYGIIYLNGSSTSMYINGATGPDFIIYKESVFTPIGEATSCEMYNSSNDPDRLSDHKPIAITLVHNKTGQQIRVINGNVECWFSTSTPRGGNIDEEKLDPLVSTLVHL